MLKRCAQVSKLFLNEDKIKIKIGDKSKIIKIYDEIFQKLRLLIKFEKDEFNFMVYNLKILNKIINTI